MEWVRFIAVTTFTILAIVAFLKVLVYLQERS